MKKMFLAGSALATILAPGLASASSADSGLRAFNPAISVILGGLYYHDDAQGEGMERIDEMDNAFHSHGGSEEHDHGDLSRGFNLGESEITMSGSVDSYFDARLTASITGSGDLDLEEAWIRSQALPAGLQIKAGRFLSAIGYHNERHSHQWNFADQNLAYRSLFGEESLGGDGVQVSWLAPTATFLQLGLEATQGDNLEGVGGTIDADSVAEDIGGGVTADDLGLATQDGPQLGVFYARLAPDLGARHALQLGLSVAHHRHSQAYHDEGTEQFVTEGDSDVYGLQAVFKRFATGNYGLGAATVQGEYFHAETDQEAVYHSNPAELGLPLTARQDAGYLSASYGFAPRWQVSARYAAAGINGQVKEGDDKEDIGISYQNSLALTWYATEFSKVRLQFNRNDIDGEDGRDTYNQVFLQYNLSLGAHGAHSF
ncbi:phosphate-selective porin O and P [Alcanivorax hongdengensis A-11-3]|uniref:Phosphate-selective porin O and P n=1 Tax=Alcanivorax hongdengensis A-11-3 TaxID=1177179 RepID=L0WFR9_9GAMM|nr:hypothetical protein [Alcanivorax hongdengensis]EKF75866.1 phosphate-selective porin O and P [Alcanivorax hongdengensis A-11-3]